MLNSDMVTEVGPSDGILISRDVSGISDEAVLVYTNVVYSFVCQAIDVFGVVTNVINIVCFAKQGFKDPINISLLGM